MIQRRDPLGGVVKLAYESTEMPVLESSTPCAKDGAENGAQERAAFSARKAPADHPPLPAAKTGVLLVNLGTPDAATAPAVKRYLKEFLSDKRIVDYPRILWLPLLHGVILNTRPPKTARAYASIWREDTDESPLRYFTRESTQNLQKEIGDAAVVDWAMRYGTPAIADRIAALKDAGVDRLLVIPLYPQYSATTTASVHDAVFDAMKALRWQPALRIAPPFHDHPAYISALAESARESLRNLDFKPDRVILSFHGIPQRLFEAGDPYHCHCAKSARLLREEMGWSNDFAPLTFQSRFGPEKWLGPGTAETIHELAGAGVKSAAVLTPGFVADCLETLEEIGIEGAETFKENGGENFAALPCLNDSPSMTRLLNTLAREELSGWLA